MTATSPSSPLKTFTAPTSTSSLELHPKTPLTPYRVEEAKHVFGSDDDTHPGTKHLFNTAKEFYVGGSLEAVNRLEHYDFLDLRCKCQPATVASPAHIAQLCP